MGPITAMSGSATMPGRAWPRLGTSAQVGLWPNRPLKWAGVRMEPPMSEPISKAVMPAASAAAEPPEEPPGVRFRL